MILRDKETEEYMVKKIRRILLLACILLAGCGNNEQNQDMLASNIKEGDFSDVADSSLVDLFWLNEEITEEAVLIEEMQSELEVFTFPDIADERIVTMEGDFYKKIEANPIDAELTWEEGATYERIKAARVYCDAWAAEIENSLLVLKEYLTETDYDMICASYEGWKQYMENTFNVERSIYYPFSPYLEVESGLAGGSITQARVMEVAAVRIRDYAIELKSLEYIFTEEVEFVYGKPPKGDIPERSYDSFRDFPHENMDYVDDETYAFLQDIYETIDFYGEIKTCDLAEYGDYIKKFKELLNNEVTFYDPETGECVFVKDYVDMYGMFLALNADVDTYNPHGFLYYVFDMDGDGTPELCMYNFKTHIFKYEEETDSFTLWKSIQTSYETIQGTRLLRWNWGGLRYTLCELDENAELAKGVLFLIYPYSDNAISHLVTVPKYFDESKQILITDKMKEQAYFCEENEVYMFNVTEEQFDKLTEDFFKAGEQSEEQLKEVCYSYDDLFNEGVDCETCRKNEEFWIN